MSTADSEPLDTTADIETPEHVRFRYELAGPARRFFAYLIDLLLRFAIIFVLGIVLLLAGFTGGEQLGQASIGVIAVIYFALEWLYYVIFEAIWSGRTPGKRALQLRVIGHEGHPIQFNQAVLRNLLRAADILPAFYTIGIVVMFNDGRFRRLGDLASGTMVVVEKRHAVEGPVRIDPPPSPAELASLPQRLPLDGDELEAIELLLRREPRIAPARAYELASLVAPIFGARLNLRVNDPLRFLKILYARARGLAIAAPQEPPPGWQQVPQGSPYGQPGYGPPGYGPPGYGSPGYAPPGYGPPGYGPFPYGQPGYGPPPPQGRPGYGPGYTAPGFGPAAGFGPPGYGPVGPARPPPPGYGPSGQPPPGGGWGGGYGPGAPPPPPIAGNRRRYP